MAKAEKTKAKAKAGAKAPAKKPSKAKKPAVKKEPKAKAPKKPASKRAAQTITTGVKKDGTKSKHNANTVKGTSKKGLSKKDATALRKKKSAGNRRSDHGKYMHRVRAKHTLLTTLEHKAKQAVRPDATEALIKPPAGIVKRYLKIASRYGGRYRGQPEAVQTAVRGLRRAKTGNGYNKRAYMASHHRYMKGGPVADTRSHVEKWSDKHELTMPKLARKTARRGIKLKNYNVSRDNSMFKRVISATPKVKLFKV